VLGVRGLLRSEVCVNGHSPTNRCKRVFQRSVIDG
jgi:hypothetical protein